MTTSPTTTLSAPGRARLVSVVVVAVVMTAVLGGPAALAGLATTVVPGACAGAADVHAGLVVDFGDVDTGSPRPADTADCVADPGANGVTLLARRFGKDHIRINSSGLICAIDDYPSSGCGERVGDRYRYWSYWKGGSAWQYSSVGPGSRTIVDGAVDGWHFVEGSASPSDGPPTNSSSAGPCAPTPTAPPPTPPPPSAGGSAGGPAPPSASSGGPTSAPSVAGDPASGDTGASDPTSSAAGSEGSSVGNDTATTGSSTDNIEGAEKASDVSSGGASGGGSVPLVAVGVALAVVALGGGAVMRFRSRTDE
ncbi:MAG: hypothetical protein ACXWB2_15605 [Acidimicrobiales bacterium]